MGYDINAWLDSDGVPQLEIIDHDSGRVRVAWASRRPHSREIKSLFHELMLLSVRENVARKAVRAVR